MHPKQLSIENYTYTLPDSKIAKHPLLQRDTAKLLVCEGLQLTDSNYYNLATHLPSASLMVFNQTKVVHARLLFQKLTGGKVEVFCLEPDERYADVQQAMQQANEVYWKCLVGGAAKWKAEQEIVLTTNDHNQTLTLKALQIQKHTDYFVLKLSWNLPCSFAEVLNIAGQVPLPPYLNRQAEQSDEERYQTMFAKEEGSVAAPTAALHFTDSLVQNLQQKNIAQAFVTLHVGAGTFKPVKSSTMAEHDMHAEWIELDNDFLNKIITQLKDKKPIIAVGTTSARTVESAYWLGVRLLKKEIEILDGITINQWYPYEQTDIVPAITAFEALKNYLSEKQISRIITRTQIIIAPGYSFKVINGLVTNFHQPGSTLLLLVAAIVGDNWKAIYQHALDNQYRFLSYGDGCLLWCN